MPSRTDNNLKMTDYEDDEDDDFDMRIGDDDYDEELGQRSTKPAVVVKRPEYIKETGNPLKVSSIENIMSKAKRENLLNEEDEENLGDNFEDSPWLPPSLEKAMEFKMKNVLRLGSAPLRSIKVIDASDLGTSTCLYFQFIKTMAVYMLFSSILSIPSIVFCFFGHGISIENQDALGLYRFTLGNIGNDINSATYLTDSKCHSTLISTPGGNSLNETCLSVYDKELTISVASNILTAMEFVQCLLFFLFVWYLSRTTRSLCKSKELVDLTASSYTVMVTGLSCETTAEHVINHFSSLYPLDKPDWKHRPPILDAQPVKSSQFSGNPAVSESWVAECTIHKRIGYFLSYFRKEKYIMDNLYRCRALMKMYSENTPHSSGPNPRKYAKAQRQMLKVALKIDRINEKLLKKQHIKFKDSEKDAEAGHLVKDSQYYIDADSVAAFVTFEYCESMARCVEDYSKYGDLISMLYYPSALKLNNKRITVQQAPGPEEVNFENLEVSTLSKFIRRLRTAIVTIILMVICFVAILQASIYKSKFDTYVPKLSYCSSDIPSLYLNSSTKITPSSISLARPSDSSTTLDASCNAIIPDTFYGVYGLNGDFSNPVGKYDVRACTQNTAASANFTNYGLCPKLGESPFCPCFSLTSDESCGTSACTKFPNSKACKKFSASTLAGCFCFDSLVGMIKSGAIFDGITSGGGGQVSSTSMNVCNPFFINYSTATGFNYLAILVALVVNQVLRKLLVILTDSEKHTSSSEMKGSLLQKVFLSTFVNMALLAILASGFITGQPESIKILSILQGSFTDINAAWFGTVGTYFVLMFFVNAMPPVVLALFKYYIAAPFARYRHYTLVSLQASNTIVRQQELNLMEVGNKFDETDNFAHLLALLFFGMMYASGLPILVPLMCLTFSLYFYTDKLLLSRYFMKPPRQGDGTMKIVLDYLPFAGILRLAITCWIYGGPNLLSLTISASGGTSVAGVSISSSTYLILLDQGVASARTNAPQVIFILERIGKPAVFPLFALLVIVVVIKFILSIWKFLPFYWIGKFISKILKMCCSDKKVYDESSFIAFGGGGALNPYDIHKKNDSLRREASAYTGFYFKFMKNKLEIPTKCLEMCSYSRDVHLTEEDIENDWEMVDQGDYLVKVKPWNATTNIEGVTRVKGERKRTYEVVAENSCNSYSLGNISGYRNAVRGLTKAAGSMTEFIEDSSAIADKYKRRQQDRVAEIGNAARNDSNIWKKGKEEDDGNAKFDSKTKPKSKKNYATGTREDYIVNYELGGPDEWDTAGDNDEDGGGGGRDGKNLKGDDANEEDVNDDSSEGSGLV